MRVKPKRNSIGKLTGICIKNEESGGKKGRGVTKRGGERVVDSGEERNKYHHLEANHT